MSTRMELETQILLYAHQRLIKGQLSECLAMGFDIEALRIIRNLDLTALTRCDARYKTGIMAGITINKRSLSRLAAQLDQTARLEAVIEQLLKNGASATMVKHFFGITRQEISDRKKLLALPANVRGRRTRHITTATEESLILHRLNTVLASYNERDRSTALIQCEALLKVAVDTNNCVNEVWDVAERHDRQGTFGWRHIDLSTASR